MTHLTEAQQTDLKYAADHSPCAFTLTIGDHRDPGCDALLLNRVFNDLACGLGDAADHSPCAFTLTTENHLYFDDAVRRLTEIVYS